MANKKLFFWASNQDLQRKIDEEKKQQEVKAKRDAYRRYIGPDAGMPLSASDKAKEFVKINAIGQLGIFLMGVFAWVLIQSDIIAEGDWQGFNKDYKPFKVALHDAYVPTDKYYGYQFGENAQVKENTKFTPHTAWCLNVFLALCTLLFSIWFVRVANVDHNTVDMMMELNKFGKKYNLNTAQVRKLVALAPSIIKNMSSDNRVYFDMLMAGDIRIENQKTFMDMAVNIIAGHLQTHPEDAQRIEDVVKERMWLQQQIHRETHTR